MVLGNVLAGRWFFFMDHLSLGSGVAVDQRRSRRVAPAVLGNAGVDLPLRAVVGIRRSDLRIDSALSGHVTRHGGSPWLLRGFGNVAAARFQSLCSLCPRAGDDCGDSE